MTSVAFKYVYQTAAMTFAFSSIWFCFYVHCPSLCLPGVSGDQLGNVGGGDGVDGVLYDVDDPVARLNVRLLHLGPVHGDGGLKV